MLRDIDKMAARHFSLICATCSAHMRDMDATASVAQRLGSVGDEFGDGGIKRSLETRFWKPIHQDRMPSATCTTICVA